ncbi:MAG: dihydrolipoyl dehydrogenase [Clostridiaceae bacterium]|jgi:dihydrolipoamide dehydrogenase|nr:dihydrolipoyl dehydrogenase [Clostridiaceae bacterium]
MGSENQNSSVINNGNKTEITCDAAIIGGGPAGYVAAIRCARNGLKTVLIEKNRLGGTCLNEGCIPTKALVSVVGFLSQLKRADDFGILVQGYQYSLEKIRHKKQQIVSSLVQGIEFLMKKNKVTVIPGKAVVAEDGLLDIEGSPQRVRYKHLILATGSVPVPIPIPGADAPDILGSKDLLELEEVPGSLAIIGGGIIGMEFAFIYAALGCEVHVVEAMPQILNLVDPDVASIVKRSARKMGIAILESARVLSIETAPDGKKLISMERKGKQGSLVVQKAAITAGRRANLEAVDLGKLGVELNDKKDGIRINEVMQTTNPAVYAVGDVTNLVMLAHAASRQGIIAADHIAGKTGGLDQRPVPSAIFTCPEIGHIGLTEKEAREKNMDLLAGKFTFRANSKAVAMQEAEGFVKVIADKETRMIIGATIIGPGATELLSLASTLVTCGITIDQAAQVIFAHPTLSEAMSEAILDMTGEAIHIAN